MNRDILTQDELKKLVSYNRHTGEMKWIVAASNRVKIGATVGTKRNTKDNKHNYYYRVVIKRKAYLVHRLCFLYVNGEFPDGIVDHIDGNGLNNSFDNLRIVNVMTNLRNAKRYTNNTSGTTGVTWSKQVNKWQAYIRDNTKLIHLGFHASIDVAITIRKAAECWCGFNENHGRLRIRVR